MEFRVEMSTRAARDLTDIYKWIHGEESTAAGRWFNGLEQAIYTPGRMPRRCPLAPEARAAKRSLRQLLYGDRPHVYRVVYKIDERRKAVYVLTIRHGAREEAGRDELS
jgi:plasmid stabilization system protein ParE